MKYSRINVTVPVEKEIEHIKRGMNNRGNTDLIINFKNTKGLKKEDILKLKNLFPNHLYIRIEGGYTDEKISRDNRDYLKYDNIYTYDEMIKILEELNKIEASMEKNLTTEQKLFYFIGYLKNKIIYHPDFENQPSKNIRSLTGLISHTTVCAGYSLILKELCDRNGISCDYVCGYTGVDYKTGEKTGPHAWNLIHLNGKIIPIDLTWSAGKTKCGEFLQVQDLANVNEFIRSHIPRADEKIQDYSHQLSSLDGNYIRAVYNMVNRNMTYDVTREVFKRKDGSRFFITLVNQKVVNGKPLYEYVYTAINDDNTIKKPMIIRSTTNVLSIHQYVKNYRKCEKELVQARKNNDTEKLQKLEEFVKDNKYVNDFYHYISDVLFSKANIKASIDRGDLFIGGIEPSLDENGNKNGIKGVTVDPNFGKQLDPLNQKLCTRSNGTSFVIEKIDGIKDDRGNICYRYKIYENVAGNDGKAVLRKSLIITDDDIFTVMRAEVVNKFLSRERLDRKENEAGGYLGRIDEYNNITYDSNRMKYFTSGMYDAFRLNDSVIKIHVPDITFDDMKRYVKTFNYDPIKDEVIYRESGKKLTDSKMLIQAKFSFTWLWSSGTKYTYYEEIPGYDYAFNDASEEVYNFISNQIQNSINLYGSIDPVKILLNIHKQSTYKYAEKIVVNLFATSKTCEIVNDLFRLQNPGAIRNVQKEITPFGNGFTGELNAHQKISEEEMLAKKIEEGKIDVVYIDDKVEMRGRR